MRILSVMVLTFSLLLAAQDVRAEKGTTDIEVTITHVGGKEVVYGSELSSMDLVLGAGGQLAYIHMVLVGGTEKDTHVWLNYNNIVGVQYRFYAITGKGKVRVKHLANFAVKDAGGVKEQITPVGLEDYK